MKVRCIRLINAFGEEVESSRWLTLGKIYHVLYIFNDDRGRRHYGIITSHPSGEWPQMGSHRADCFEVVSEVTPSNWQRWADGKVSGISPAAWQTPTFYESFYDHDPATYPIYERERDIIFREDA